MQRSPQMVVGLLGILKAGATYVPLDPAYPQNGCVQLADSTPAVRPESPDPPGRCWKRLHKSCRGRFRSLTSMVIADTVGAAVGREPRSGIAWSDLRPSGLHHLHSGSTGRPKGIAVATHRSSI